MKEVLFLYSWLPSKILGTLSYPNHCLMTKFSSICPVNLPRQISKVFVHLEALWRKYYLCTSKWHEIYTVPSYAQIITLLQIAAQSSHLCEPSFNFYFLSRLAHCKASAIYTTPIALKLFGQSSIPKSFPHANIQLYFPSKSSSANFQSFYSPRSFVKEVQDRNIVMSWIFATYSICQSHSSTQNFSSI